MEQLRQAAPGLKTEMGIIPTGQSGGKVQVPADSTSSPDGYETCS